MSVKEVIMGKAEFINYLSEHVEDVSDIAKALRFVESAFILQNDAHRPAYIFSISEKIAEEDMEVVRSVFMDLGVLGVFLPEKLMSKINYVGTVTPENIGIEREK